jgi:hypothetical protein
LPNTLEKKMLGNCFASSFQILGAVRQVDHSMPN